MKPIERYEKYNGDKVAKEISEWCGANKEKYKYGCYHCPIYGSCDEMSIKTFEEIKDVLLCKNTHGPVCWEKHLDDFNENKHKNSYEVDLERREHIISTSKAGWRE